MGETEDLDKSWLLGRVGRREETPDSGVIVYVDGESSGS